MNKINAKTRYINKVLILEKKDQDKDEVSSYFIFDCIISLILKIGQIVNVISSDHCFQFYWFSIHSNVLFQGKKVSIQK